MAFVVEADLIFERYLAIPVGLLVWILAIVTPLWVLTQLAVGFRDSGFWSTIFNWGIWALISTPFLVYFAATGGWALFADDASFFAQRESGLSYSRWFGIMLLAYGLVLVWVAIAAARRRALR